MTRVWLHSTSWAAFTAMMSFQGYWLQASKFTTGGKEATKYIQSQIQTSACCARSNQEASVPRFILSNVGHSCLPHLGK